MTGAKRQTVMWILFTAAGLVIWAGGGGRVDAAGGMFILGALVGLAVGLVAGMLLWVAAGGRAR